ncbi:hormogonium polysaccharide biosynthesis protein HpsA [Kamptonema animale CS-326]|jgi:type II secretory pathway pseudopilin PulG|uniref:hormogonium polysaccharide biosynthesis protein HpsA n=1 Tax=Kamptonema animale TaxID=92934 RepID=UPI00232CC00A|nr:hormogonium polysaccharide biosynthesis protein HpsA [Kamptonema animale]MDB9510322.1 hormogonium polysaccharide biosynthesis protein HpsA [Kamptonema animale CS-326]
MFKRKLAKVIVSLLRRIANVSRAGAKRLMRTMLRSLMAMGRRAKLPVAGFVLPTVTMVMLVVVLLTLAITLRSFDRAQNARNVRVNQQVLAAATPALERAKAKIEYLLNEDPTRPTGTPSDISIKRALSTPTTGTDTYTFNDEIRLRVGYNLDRASLPTASWDSNADLVENKEVINTAWRFPVDTDNNGRFDSYTIYGVYFRSPPRDGDNTGTTAGQFLTERKPLETRTPPMPGSLGSAQCAAALGTSASLVGDSGWYQSDGKLKKSFFVYTVTVPITAQSLSEDTSSLAGQLEVYTGTKGFSALEYQQDRVRLPLLNNAVVYEDDLEISPGAAFRLNGAMLTNSNLLVTSTGGSTVDLFLISGQNSCYYKQENSKIIVAGNVVNGSSSGAQTGTSTVHLFQGAGTPPIDSGADTTIDTTNQSVTEGAISVLYNNEAYANRLSVLVNAQMTANPDTAGPPLVPNTANDPISVQKAVAGGKNRADALQTYFENLTRKVPFSEVTDVTTDTPPSPVIEGSGDELRPNQIWSLPTTVNADATVADATGPTNLNIQVNQLVAQDPNPIGGSKPQTEDFMGDRVIVGNNLPAKWWNGAKFVGGTTTQDVAGGTWSDGTTQRTRTSQKQILAEVGVTNRGDFWEKAAAQQPINPLSAIGGLRVITGAGVYERLNSFLPPPSAGTYDDPATTTVTEQYPVVWPDSMPMSPVLGSQIVYDNVAGNWATTALAATSAALPAAATPTIDPSTLKYAKGDLRMRATAVYHYATDAYDQPDFNSSVVVKATQAPIACVSSYYDPSTASTARNLSTLTDVSGEIASGTRDDNIGSNNGIVFGPPVYTIPAAAATPTNGILGGASPTPLENQANMVFPDGRFVNEQLRTALMTPEAERNLAEQAAIDSTACAFGILGTTGFTLGTAATIPDGAIREVALLNSREVKAIAADDTSTPVDETFTLSSDPAGAGAANLSSAYNLALEERMPLEIRVTQIDLNQLRNQDIPLAGGINGPSPEYLLPNSGIIYASRDDAAPDRSDRTADTANTTVIPYGIDAVQSNIISKADSRLDPTRRPHGIMLTNGRYLARNDVGNDGQNDTAPSNVADVVKEKGLTLVSNLPVYVQDNFNEHTQEEFGAVGNLTQPAWGNFYTRALPLNPNFACRPGDPRLPTCTTGDTWRAATVLADAVTVLSRNFRPGFRDEGDFDLRNNAGQAIVGYDLSGDGTIQTTPTFNEADFGIDLNGNGNTTDTGIIETQVTAKAARLLNGFYNNNFVTNGLSSGATFNVNGGPVTSDDNAYSTTTNALSSSYFNNFVTPVQRRGAFPEYVMEMCFKLPVSACGPGDWVIIDNNNLLITPNAGTTTSATSYAALTNGTFLATNLNSGTTATSPAPAYQRFPRRVAFQRNNTYQLIPDPTNNNQAIPLGVNGTNVTLQTGGAVPTSTPANTLWFRATTTPNAPTGGDDYTNANPLSYRTALATNLVVQPQLVPVLQIHVTQNGDPTTPIPTNQTNINSTSWLPRAQETIFNLVVGSGDNPARAVGNDFNGGMQNLTRFLENWSGGLNTRILGSFIQLSRSAYATAPYTAILNSPVPTPTSIFSGYPNFYSINNNSNRTPNFSPPGRQWGYDVGLLSQSPDLFTQLFTTPPTKTNSDEFFREVGRDDVWVKTLLCAKKDDDVAQNAVSNDQRPTSCNEPNDWDDL